MSTNGITTITEHCTHEDAVIVEDLSRIGEILRNLLDNRSIHDNHRPYLIHLSHSDLDGIGALSLSYYMQWYINRSHGRWPNDITPRIERPLMEWHWTSKLGTDFSKELHHMAEHVNHVMLAEFSRVTCDQSIGEAHIIPITVLITDIGSITPDLLRNEFVALLRSPRAPRVSFDINIIVLDHHQNSILDGHDSVSLDVSYANLPGKGNITASARFVIQTGDNHCGTSILWSALDDHGDAELNVLRNTVEEITRWDTGRGGNWYIPAEMRHDRNYHDNEVSEAVKLNQWWHLHERMCDDNELALHTFMRELAARYASDLYDNIASVPTSVLYGNRMDAIWRDTVEMNNRFDQYHDKIRTVDRFINRALGVNVQGVQRDLDIPDSLWRAACDYLHAGTPRVGVYLYANKNDPYPSYTNYSRYIFTTEPTRWAWLMIIDTTLDDGRVRFDLRSGDPSVNMAAWAKKFGGGGHPCAAGFTINFNETDRI